MRSSLLSLTAGAGLLAAPMLMVGASSAAAAPAAASLATMYSATLNPLNNQRGSGTLSLKLNGSTATITERVTGLAATFQGAPFPHVQHIHGGAAGTCPTASDDTNGDGVVATLEAVDNYGGILTTLSKTGGTAPADGTNIKIAPGGASYDYSRTITLDAKTLAAVRGGNAVIVVHGDDPTLLSKKAQAEKSDIPGTTSLPLAATAPALCGPLRAMPAGGVATGGGATSGIEDGGLIALGAGALVAAAGTVALRRRSTSRA